MIKLYALKINESIAQCPITEKPLIAPYNKEYKNKLLELKKLMTIDYPEFKNAKLIRLVECSLFKGWFK